MVLPLLFVSSCAGPGHEHATWEVLGTEVAAEVHAFTPESAVRIISEMRTAMERLEPSMNPTSRDSLLAIMNREAGSRPFVITDKELFRCLKLAQEYSRRTEGAFDATVGPLVRLYGEAYARGGGLPDVSEVRRVKECVGWEKVELFPEAGAVRFLDSRVEIDLGGIAPGYYVDVAARNFALPAARGGRLEICGTIYAWGSPPGGGAWQAELRSASDSGLLVGTVTLDDRAMSTSGDFADAWREASDDGPVVFDVPTGRPAGPEVVAATVFADSAMESDALATAFRVAGSQGSAAILRRSSRIEAILLVRTGGGVNLLLSGSLRHTFTIDPEFEKRIGSRIRFVLPPGTL